jgi:hypothetical protein
MRLSTKQVVAVETLFQRYLAGEHKQVWAEHVALGALEPGEQSYAATLAVARETMRRARYNIGQLVGRLKSADFAFGPYWWEAPTYKDRQTDPMWREWYPAVFSLPKPNVHEQLAELEARAGRAPSPLFWSTP